MNVLALTPYVAWPLDHGGRIRTHHLLRAIAQDHHVTNIAVARTPGERRDAEALAQHGLEVLPVLVPTYDASLPAARLAKWFSIALGRSSLPRRWRVEGFADAVRRALASRRFEIAVVDSLWMDVYRDAMEGLPYVASTHNVESDVLLEAAARHSGAARLIAARDARLLSRREAEFCARARAVIAVSDADAARFRVMAPGAHVTIIENGVDLDIVAPLPPADGGGPVLFVGSFDYAANVDAATLLVREILPRLRARDPGTRILLAGRRPGRKVLALGQEPGVTVAGDVSDLAPLYAGASAVAVPIQVGGGSRIKILEALARGRAVVTTTVGVRGLDVTDGVEALVADTPDAIADALLRVRAEPMLRARLAAAGRAFVERRHAWSALEPKFREILAHCETPA